MDLRFVVPVQDRSLRLPVKEPSKLPRRHPLLVGMATCHSLTRIDGLLSGDPLDFKVATLFLLFFYVFLCLFSYVSIFYGCFFVVFFY